MEERKNHINRNNPTNSYPSTKITVGDLWSDANKNENMLNDTHSNCSILSVKSVNTWLEEAKSRGIPKMLFSEFWFEGELCILFADTNLGKSILAVQIGDSITRGISIPHFRCEAPRQRVLYLDFELSDKQFEARYSNNYQNHYKFDEWFLRGELNPEPDIPEGYKSLEEYLYNSIENKIKEHRSKVLIIDNLTYLKNDVERARDALPLMKQLKALKKKYDLSILALAHTPKRNSSLPITKNDLQGSKMLINFCDSAFAIGESRHDSSIRYLKQIKVRNTEFIYDIEHVCVCQVNKNQNFLSFKFEHYGYESDHLTQVQVKEGKELNKKIIEEYKTNPHNSFREIAAKIGTNHKRVSRVLHREGLIYDTNME